MNKNRSQVRKLISALIESEGLESIPKILKVCANKISAQSENFTNSYDSEVLEDHAKSLKYMAFDINSIFSKEKQQS